MNKKKARMTWLTFSAASLNIVGTLMLTFVLGSVHQKFKEEREIDQAVIEEMNREQIVVLVALILISLAWAVTVIAEFQDTWDRKRDSVVRHIVLQEHASAVRDFKNSF